MRHKNKIRKEKIKTKAIAAAIALLSFTFHLSSATAQESINATGGESSGSGGTVSYSIGQLNYHTQAGSNASIAAGVQQPYEISQVIGIEETEINLDISVYPNPTTDYLLLKVGNENSNQLSYQLYDINSKLLQEKKVTGDEAQINMSTYTPSTYFLRIISNNQKIKEFKIIKN